MILFNSQLRIDHKVKEHYRCIYLHDLFNISLFLFCTSVRFTIGEILTILVSARSKKKHEIKKKII